MSKKYSLLVSIVLLLSTVAMSSAVNITWSNGGGDGGNWNNTANWTGGVVPDAIDDWAKIRIATGPVFTGQTANAYRVYLEGTNGTLTMNSGTLNTVNHIYAGAVLTDTATLNMNGGDVNIAGTFYISRDAGSVADVNLSGGTITCAVLTMGSNGGTGGRIDISSTGKLIINGNAIATITPWITSGWIKAYGGTGTVSYDYGVTTPLKTTVWGTPQTKAGGPSPDNNAVNVSILTDLSWRPLPGTTSHDVYFGTVFNDVNTAHRLPGDLIGNNIVDWNDILKLTEYWLLDPIDSDPYAGVNDDDIVDFFDYALLSQDWKNSANSVFKGNQDSNTFDPGTLVEATIYYWRIDEVNGPNTVTGDVWKFTTQGFANIKKGPYLIYPNINTQMTVLWQVDVTSTCNIAWGTDTSYSLGSVNTTEYNTGTDGHQHKYNITGLTPGTKYYYRVTISGVPYTGSFYAAPAADATNVKFFMYGDTRTNGGSHNSVAGQMVSAYTADAAYQTMVLHAGDWVNADAEADWTSQWYNYSWTNIVNAAANMPLMGCIGNHEGGATIYKKYRPFPFVAATYFSFDYGPVHVAVVDQYGAGGYDVGSTQYNWLHTDLANSTKPWKIIVLHQPGWHAAGGHDNDTVVQSAIQPLCVDHGVAIVLGGHVHYYSRASVPFDSTQYPPWGYVQHVTSGGGGAPLYTPVAGQPNVVTYSRSLNVVKVVISGNTLTCTAISETGTVLDTFTLTKP